MKSRTIFILGFLLLLSLGRMGPAQAQEPLVAGLFSTVVRDEDVIFYVGGAFLENPTSISVGSCQGTLLAEYNGISSDFYSLIFSVPRSCGPATNFITVVNSSGSGTSDFTVTIPGPAPTVLSAGDIAFTGYNSEGSSDSFSFMLLKDIAAGTIIKFTDRGWDDTTGFRTGAENELTWTSSSAMTLGTQVAITRSGGVTAWDTATAGTVSQTDGVGTFDFATSGDQVFAYQGTAASPTIIAGLHANLETGTDSSDWDGSGSAAASTSRTALPNALTDGVNAIALFIGGTEKDNAIYNGPLTGTAASLRASINNRANWLFDDATPYSLPPTAAANTAPTDISLSSGTVSAFDSANTSVGILSATDAEDSTFTYSITAVKDPSNQAVSNANGALFDLGSSGSASATGVAIATLRAVAPSSLSGGNYTLTVQADDGHGGTFSKDFMVTVSNSLVVDVTAIDGSAVAGTYADDAADSGGLDLREALYYANNMSGNITIAFASTLSGTITLPGLLSVRDGITFLMDSDTDSRSLTISSGSFALGGSLTVNVASGDAVNINSDLQDDNFATTSLTKSGTGTLILSGANLYSGTTTVSGGTLSVGGDGNLGSGAVTLDGGALAVTGATTIDNAFVLGGSNGTINSDADITLSGVISGSGNLTKTGTGTLTLSGSNTYTGTTTISSGGRLSVAADSNLGGGALVLDGASMTPTVSMTIDNDVILGPGGGLVSILSLSTTLTLSGVVSGSGGLSKTLLGTLRLSGNNTYTGETTVTRGYVIADNDHALGDTSGGTTVNNGATLQISSGVTVAEPLMLTGTGQSGNGALQATNGTATVTGAIELTAEIRVQVASSTLVLSGVISGDSGIEKTADGTLVLSGANTYSGNTTIVQGYLLALHNNALGTTNSGTTVSSGGTLRIGSGVTIEDNLGVGGTGESDTGALQVQEPATTATVTGTVILSSDALVNTPSGTLLLSGVVRGTSGSGIIKVGGGTLVLGGTNTYSGTTTVTEGTLSVTGRIGSPSAVTLSSGATLSGTGTLSGPVTVSSGATIAPGTSAPGALTLAGGLTMLGGSTLAVDINGATAGTGYDQVYVLNTLDVTGATLTTTLGYTPSQGDVYSILVNDTGSAITGTFSGLAEGGTVTLGAYGATASYAGGDGHDFTLTISGSPNDAPTLSNLNGDSVTWAGVGNTVTLDSGADAVPADTELGNDWTGASLTVQRSDIALSADVFGFDTSGAFFSVSGGNLQIMGQTFATFTSSGGVLTVNFTSSTATATTSLVQDVIRRVTYRNDTPAGDATIRFSLSDGTDTTTADVTVTSDYIYVTSASDTATINVSDGVSFSEAVAIAAADTTGTQTLVIDGSLAVTFVQFSANPTINEDLIVDADAASGADLGNGTLTIGSGKTLTIHTGTSHLVSVTGVLAGAGGNLTKTGAGTLDLGAANTFGGTLSVTAGTVSFSDGLAIADTTPVTVASGAVLLLNNASETIGSLSGAGNVLLSDNSLTTGGNDTSTTFAGAISGTGGLTKTGTGTFTLSGANTYSGTTTVSAGTLALNGGSAIKDTGAITIASGTTLTVGASETVGSVSGAGAITLSSETLTLGGNDNSTTLSGVISGSGNLAKSGTGTLTLSGANTYSGTTTVSGGTLSVAADGNLGGGGVTLDGGTLTVTGATTINNAVVVGNNHGTISQDFAVTLSGVISGSGNLTKSGTNTLTLSGNNTYSGTTTVSGGTLRVAADSNLGGGTLTLDGGTLAVTASTTIDNAVILGAGGGVVNISTFNATLTLSGVVSGSGPLTKTGNGSIMLSGNNTYTGSTTVSAGYLIADHNNALGNTSSDTTVPNGGTLRINPGVTVAEPLMLGGFGAFLSKGALVVTGGTGALTGDITLIGVTQIDISSGTLTLSGAISGDHGVVKNGNGTLILSGTYTSTKGISVAGTLLVNGSHGDGPVYVSGGTLGGTGTIGGAVEVTNGGTLSPGVDGPGTLSVGSLTMVGGTTLAVDINGATAGTGYDQVIVNGTVDVTDATLSTTLGYTPTQGDVYTIIANDDTDAITGTFSGLAEGGTRTLGAYDATVSYLGGTGNDFTLTPQVNATPTDITLTPASINLSAMSAGATVGTLTTTDADSGDMHTYSFATGTGDTDNGSFTLAGDTLKIGGSVLAKGTYAVRIKTDDGNGGTFEKGLTVTVVDNIPPTVVSILRKTPATQLTKTTPVVYQVTFSEPVVNVATSSFAVAAVNGSDIVGSVTGVTGGPTVYDVTVSITEGQGGFRLVVPNTDP